METVFTSTEAGCRAHNKTGNRKSGQDTSTVNPSVVPPTMLLAFGLEEILEEKIGWNERKEVKVISFRIQSSSGFKLLINPSCSRGQYSCNDNDDDNDVEKILEETYPVSF